MPPIIHAMEQRAWRVRLNLVAVSSDRSALMSSYAFKIGAVVLSSGVVVSYYPESF